MKRSDFMLAGQQDREQYIVRPGKQIPLTMLVPGSESHPVSTKELTVSFLYDESRISFLMSTLIRRVRA